MKVKRWMNRHRQRFLPGKRGAHRHPTGHEGMRAMIWRGCQCRLCRANETKRETHVRRRQSAARVARTRFRDDLD